MRNLSRLSTLRRVYGPRPHACLSSPAMASRHCTAWAVFAACLVVVLSVVLIVSNGGIQ
jgi:hypothetical protein